MENELNSNKNEDYRIPSYNEDNDKKVSTPTRRESLSRVNLPSKSKNQEYFHSHSHSPSSQGYNQYSASKQEIKSILKSPQSRGGGATGEGAAARADLSSSSSKAMIPHVVFTDKIEYSQEPRVDNSKQEEQEKGIAVDKHSSTSSKEDFDDGSSSNGGLSKKTRVSIGKKSINTSENESNKLKMSQESKEKYDKSTNHHPNVYKIKDFGDGDEDEENSFKTEKGKSPVKLSKEISDLDSGKKEKPSSSINKISVFNEEAQSEKKKLDVPESSSISGSHRKSDISPSKLSIKVESKENQSTKKKVSIGKSKSKLPQEPSSKEEPLHTLPEGSMSSPSKHTISRLNKEESLPLNKQLPKVSPAKKPSPVTVPIKTPRKNSINETVLEAQIYLAARTKSPRGDHKAGDNGSKSTRTGGDSSSGSDHKKKSALKKPKKSAASPISKSGVKRMNTIDMTIAEAKAYLHLEEQNKDVEDQNERNESQNEYGKDQDSQKKKGKKSEKKTQRKNSERTLKMSRTMAQTIEEGQAYIQNYEKRLRTKGESGRKRDAQALNNDISYVRSGKKIGLNRTNTIAETIKEGEAFIGNVELGKRRRISERKSNRNASTDEDDDNERGVNDNEGDNVHKKAKKQGNGLGLEPKNPFGIMLLD